jgi:uncharacterized protein (TIGR00106 family)
MNVIVDLCIVPIGVGVSLSPYVAACENVLSKAGLKTMLHANGTNIEGEWDEVLAAIKKCHQVVHEMGAPRIFTVIKLGTRIDRAQTMEQKISSVSARLESR